MYMSPTTVAIVASAELIMRHTVRCHLRPKNAPVIMNYATLALHSCRIPVYPYAAIVKSTRVLAAG